MSARAAPARDGPVVAFQGEPGAFSEEAARHLLGDAISTLPRRSFEEVRAAVVGGEADLGLLPVENSVAGTVVGAYDALARGGVRVVDEVVRPIRHFLLAVSGASEEGLWRVLSHPVALAQCTRYLRSRPEVEAVAVHDTAGAARSVAEGGDTTVGAIAPRGAAAEYGLEILAGDLQDRPDNQTRFYLLARGEESLEGEETLEREASLQDDETLRDGGEGAAGRRPAGERGWKTAVLFRTLNRPGALVRVLEPFAARGVNLSKLESRPGGDPWTYRFFLELEVDARRDPGRSALREARDAARELHVLGVFPRSPSPHLGARREGSPEAVST